MMNRNQKKCLKKTILKINEVMEEFKENNKISQMISLDENLEKEINKKEGIKKCKQTVA